MVVDPLLCRPVQLVQLNLGIGVRGEFHFEPGDKMGFDQFDWQLRIIAMDSLHGLINGQPSPIFPDELAMSGVNDQSSLTLSIYI